MFKIARGFGAVEKGVPYVIVTATLWKEFFIYLERFILIVDEGRDPEVVIQPLRTKISLSQEISSLGDEWDLNKLLEEEFLLAKYTYQKWLFEQIGDKAFSQFRQMVWQEDNNGLFFPLMCYRLKRESKNNIVNILLDSCSEELKEFVNKVRMLRLQIEQE
ncbi:MAG: hypothetical protein AB1650_01705 [Candidatus Omnitrophota bacterium]